MEIKTITKDINNPLPKSYFIVCRSSLFTSLFIHNPLNLNISNYIFIFIFNKTLFESKISLFLLYNEFILHILLNAQLILVISSFFSFNDFFKTCSIHFSEYSVTFIYKILFLLTFSLQILSSIFKNLVKFILFLSFIKLYLLLCISYY